MELKGMNKRIVQAAYVFFIISMIAMTVFVAVVLVGRYNDARKKEEETLSEIRTKLESLSDDLENPMGYSDYPMLKTSFEKASNDIEAVKGEYQKVENLYDNGELGYIVDETSRDWYYDTVKALDTAKRLLEEVNISQFLQEVDYINACIESDFSYMESELTRIKSKLSSMKLVGHDEESKKCEELLDTYDSYYDVYLENAKIVKAEMDSLHDVYKVLKSSCDKMDTDLAQAHESIKLWYKTRNIDEDIEKFREMGEELKEDLENE